VWVLLSDERGVRKHRKRCPGRPARVFQHPDVFSETATLPVLEILGNELALEKTENPAEESASNITTLRRVPVGSTGSA
jgi:hypothetical protein